MAATSHQSIDTLYNADSVEWCPLPDYQDLLLCGTYQLHEADKDREDKTDEAQPQVRVGRLYLYQLKIEHDIPELQLCTSLDMPGILDIKWSYQSMDGQPCFAVVNSVGQLKVFVVKEKSVVALVTEENLGFECLGLSLEWNNMLQTRDHPRLVSSDSQGHLHVHQLCGGCLQKLASWKAHDFEAWISAFDQWNINTVFSGGDDCKLKAWDLRMDMHHPVVTSKRHTMGVCSIQSNPAKEYNLATGSYDETMLFWDTRHMRQPLSEIALGGGVWRIKWEPTKVQHVLTATMYNGFHVVDTYKADPSIICHYKEHQSIAYGADWCRNVNQSTLATDTSFFTIATCSFYDHNLKLWTFSDNKIE